MRGSLSVHFCGIDIYLNILMFDFFVSTLFAHCSSLLYNLILVFTDVTSVSIISLNICHQYRCVDCMTAASCMCQLDFLK